MQAMSADSASSRTSQTRRSVLAALAGCALGTATGCWNFSIDHRQMAAKAILPPLVKPKDALSLEVYFIPRPAGDPLLGESLWRQLDETAVKSPEVRARLRSAGLRIGLAGSNAPPALRAAATEQQKSGSVAQRLSLLAGGETNLEVTTIPTPFQLRTIGAKGESVQGYSGARCVFKLSGERPQDGWVRLHFQPELHHGPVMTRRSPSDADWKLQQGQAIDHLWEQCFDLEMNVGEMVVIGAAPDAEDDLLGARFFRYGAPPSASESVLVIRVADVQQIEAVRSKDW